MAKQGGDLFDMAKDGTSIPGDVRRPGPNLVASKLTVDIGWQAAFDTERPKPPSEGRR